MTYFIIGLIILFIIYVPAYFLAAFILAQFQRKGGDDEQQHN